MKTDKWKLANSILTEIEAIKECKSFKTGMVLAEILALDAMKLAKIIKKEEEKKEKNIYENFLSIK